MGFFDAIKSGFSQYVGFSGRASRSEYWLWLLFTILVSMATGILDAAIFPESDVSPLNAVSSLVFFLPGLAVSVRRLHDIDRSGWWLLLSFLPVIGWILLFVWAVTKSDPGPNRFGPPPLAPTDLRASPA